MKCTYGDGWPKGIFGFLKAYPPRNPNKIEMQIVRPKNSRAVPDHAIKHQFHSTNEINR